MESHHTGGVLLGSRVLPSGRLAWHVIRGPEEGGDSCGQRPTFLFPSLSQGPGTLEVWTPECQNPTQFHWADGGPRVIRFVSQLSLRTLSDTVMSLSTLGLDMRMPPSV